MILLQRILFSAGVVTCVLASTAFGQFTTIINVPPAGLSQTTTVDAGTQVNLLNGSNVQVSVNIHSGGEVNVLGGNNTNGLFVSSNATLNIGGGITNVVIAGDGSSVNLSNGTVDYLRMFGGTLNMTGGAVAKSSIGRYGTSEISNDTTANISGGAFGRIYNSSSATTVNVFGGDFRHNGISIGGLDNVGDSVQFDPSADSIVSGTLADGTPFQFAQRDLNRINPSGVLHLFRSALPAAPESVSVPADAAPRGARAGQTVSVGSGGILPNSFRPGWGSTVNIGTGAIVGSDFAPLANSTVNISGGTVGEHFHARTGSIVNISGGSIGPSSTSSSGSLVHISGGSIGPSFQPQGDTIVTGGYIAGIELSAGTVTVSGGSIGGFNEAGGVTLVGGEFRLNDVPIAGLNNVGDSLQFQVPTGQLLTGTYTDGTPFIFSSNFLNGVRLQRETVSAAEPAVINVPASPAPYGTRSGQTVVVGPGGVLGPTFQVGRGGILKVEGGTVGATLNIVTSTVEISGGSVGQNAKAYPNSRLKMTGGALGSNFVAFNGAEIEIKGGSVGSSLHALSGSTVNISGGTIGNLLTLDSGSKLNISGGSFGSIELKGGSVTNITGGLFGRSYSDFVAATASVTNLFAQSLLLNGGPIPGLQPGVPFTLTNKTGLLTGVFANGNPFNILLFTPPVDPRVGGSKGFRPGSTLTLILVPEPVRPFFARDGQCHQQYRATASPREVSQKPWYVSVDSYNDRGDLHIRALTMLTKRRCYWPLNWGIAAARIEVAVLRT